MSEVIDVFKEYKAERYPSMQERFQISSSLGHIRASVSYNLVVLSY